MDVTRKSFGFMLDEFVTVSNKIWHLQDRIEQPDCGEAETAAAFRQIQKLNVRRNQLIKALDEIVDPSAFSAMEKTYK